MARQELKARLLIAFVVVCLALVGLIWADSLIFQEDAAAAPGYYRQAPDVAPSVFLTMTAEAIEFRQQLSGTPTPHERGSGQGQGHGEGNTNDDGLDSLDMDH